MKENNLKETEETNKKEKKGNKKKKVIIIVLILLLIVALIVVITLKLTNKSTKKAPESNVIETDNKEVYAKYKMSGNKLENFDLSFLQLETNDQNIIYSPLSIKYALEMLSEGAKGTSKDQIDALIGAYQTRKYTNSANMSFGNAVFIKDAFKNSVKDKYVSNLKNKYNADVIYDAFKNPDNVNAWVKNKTFGLVDKLVGDVSNTQFVLLNALAIDMEWNNKIQAVIGSDDRYYVYYLHEKYNAFISELMEDNYGTVKFNNNSINAKAVEIGASINNYDIVKTLGEDNIRRTITEEYEKYLKGSDEFQCGGDEGDVDTVVNKYIKELDSNYKKVKASTDFSFHVDDNVKVFAKDLKKYNGITLEYIGIMPRNKTLKEFIKETDAASINNIINKIKKIELDNFEKGKITKITGGIPLFKYEYQLDLVKDLNNLGITDIFDESKVNLSNITDKNIVIDQAAHKANIEFSNDGIKAAAATSFGGAGATGCGFEYLYDVPVVEIDLTFDNPYLYIIRDKNTKETWFVGTVYEPIENTNPYARVINK